jgi:hypothetical protein
LTTLFGNAAISTATPIDARPPRKKRGWLPLLTVLFCLSYGLMTMLIVEQGETIESQRALIRELFHDSAELTATKIRAQMEKNLHAPKTPVAKTPSTQTPSTQAPSVQNPAATPQRGQNSTQKAAPQYQVPSRQTSDLVDARRALVTI